MFKTIIKIAGIYALTEFAFQLGKGRMLRVVKSENPEVGEIIYNRVVAAANNETSSLFCRAMGGAILLGEDVDVDPNVI